jgi:hypothetical protein
VLREYGLHSPPDVQVKVLEDADQAPEVPGVVHLVVPARPPAEDLLEEELIGTGIQPVSRCGCDRCHRCERCYCGRCGCSRCDRAD